MIFLPSGGAFWSRQSLAWIDGSRFLPKQGRGFSMATPRYKNPELQVQPSQGHWWGSVREKPEAVTDLQAIPSSLSLSCSNYIRDLFDRGVNMDEAGEVAPF